MSDGPAERNWPASGIHMTYFCSLSFKPPSALDEPRSPHLLTLGEPISVCCSQGQKGAFHE